MAEKIKTYNVKQFSAKLGKVKSKFTDEVANAENWSNLPAGTYNVQLSTMVLQETKDGHPMIRVPYTVIDGEHAGRKGSVNAVVDPNRCVKEGNAAGTPWGLFDISKIAKSIGVSTTEGGSARDLDDVLADMEEVTSAEPGAVLVVREREYEEKKNGKPTGVMKTAINEFFSGLLVVDDEEGSDEEEEEEEAEESEESEEEEEEEEAEESEEEEEEAAEPAFNVGESVKYKEGRKILKGTIRKVNEDGTYNVMGQDKKLKRNIPEDELFAA